MRVLSGCTRLAARDDVPPLWIRLRRQLSSANILQSEPHFLSSNLGVIIMSFISRKDVLELFGISVWTLRRWEKQREFPAAIPVSGAIRMYVKSEVDSWVLSRAIKKASSEE
jgi:predicted DNA-binding transcriptional regulator AlpA